MGDEIGLREAEAEFRGDLAQLLQCRDLDRVERHRRPRPASRLPAADSGVRRGTAPLRPALLVIVKIVIDSVIYPLQTATNLLAYESGVSRHRRCGRFGLMVLGRTMLVGLGVALPYWSALDRWFTLTFDDGLGEQARGGCQ